MKDFRLKVRGCLICWLKPSFQSKFSNMLPFCVHTRVQWFWLFLQNGASQTENKCKIWSCGVSGWPSRILGNIHVYKICFSFFEPFHPILALKLAKKCHYKQNKTIFVEKFEVKFSITFSSIAFSHVFLKKFRIQSQHQILHFWYPYGFFEIYFLSHKSPFYQLCMQTWTERLKKRETFTYKCVLELNVASINSLVESIFAI
jgi:hypothetical protein